MPEHNSEEWTIPPSGDDDEEVADAHELGIHILHTALEQDDDEIPDATFRLQVATAMFLDSIAGSLKLLAMSSEEREEMDLLNTAREMARAEESWHHIQAVAKQEACPTCEAQPGERCKTSKGKWSSMHMPRLRLSKERDDHPIG